MIFKELKLAIKSKKAIGVNQMPIVKETQVSASVILERKTYERLKKVAKAEKRSVSAQIGYIIERFLRGEGERE